MAFPEPFPVEHWPKSAWECEGLEFDWFCADRSGALAVFTSAGRGFIPPAVFQMGVDAYNEFIRCIASRVGCEAHLATSESGSFRDWKLMAEHGLYAFDFQDVHRTNAQKRNCYDLIYHPGIPALLTELPVGLQRQVPRTTAAFAESLFLPLSNLPQ